MDRQQDVRGIIGLISVVGLFGVVFFQLLRGIAVAIPPEIAGVVGSVVGFYFGAKGAVGAAGSAEQTAQSVQLGHIEQLVNARASKMEEEIAALREQVIDRDATIHAQREHK